MAGTKSPTNGVSMGALPNAPTPTTPLFNANGAQLYSSYKPPATAQPASIQPLTTSQAPMSQQPKPRPTTPAAAPAAPVAAPFAVNTVAEPAPPQAQQSGVTNDALAGLMGTQPPETPQILASQDQLLRPLGQRMFPFQSQDVAQRGRRVY